MENVFQCQRLFYKLEYNLHVFLNSKPEGQYFAVNWVKSVIVPVERKSCNSSFPICRCFGGYLKSVWVGKNDSFIIFFSMYCCYWLFIPMQFVSLIFQNIFIPKMFDAKNWIFRRKPIISISKFYPFFDKIGFSQRKRKCGDFFPLGIVFTRTPKCHTFVNHCC